MAETLVKLVLEKLGDTFVKEVLKSWGVDEQVERVRRELDWIQAFLKDADRKQIEDEMQKKWVREVRDVAYQIEDVIDTFFYEVSQKKPGKWEAVKRMFGKKFRVTHKLGDEIDKILAMIHEIDDIRVRYGIKNLGEGSGGGKKLPVRPPVLPDIDDLDIVGLDADKINIVKELLDETTPRSCVVSIVGPGGLGKTTLAKKVYNSDEVQRKFNIRIWVAISKEFELINVLRKIRGEIRKIDETEQGRDEEYFLVDICRSLREKKYLLIIDDVWTTNLWMAIKRILPNENNGSRILMTTRFFEVAKEADPGHEPYKLNFLTEEPSLELLLKKAHLNREIQNECPEDLSNLAKQFVIKCGGLPLALVVLGGMLAKKEFTYYAWSKVMKTMNWHANEHQKVCMEIIGTSYDDLPLALKSCFMYFAAFPEDYNIYAPRLLQMWIAEGFIPHEENKTLEDTAESFLEDLVQRSMIQVSERSLYNDSIRWCRIHDLLHDVAIQKAKEDNFLWVCSTRDGEQSYGQTRRVAVHNLNCNEMINYTSPKLRTLLCFNSQFSDCSRHRLLKVLSDHDRNRRSIFGLDQADLKCFEELSQLRYLKLSKWSIKWNQRCFEKLIGRMKFLQTLYLEFYGIHCDLPDCVWHIKTLRHIMLYFREFALGPPPTADLRNLQTLVGVKGRESWEYTNLPNLPNLLSLSIEIIEGSSWGLVAAFLHTLEKLVELTIKGQNIPTEVVDMKDFSFYQQLIFLRYVGRLSCLCFEVAMFPTHLTQLSFNGSQLQQDHLTVLEKLQGLKILELIEAYLNETMKCSARGFPHLQFFSISSNKLAKWDIEECAMPMLKDLHIQYCPNLHDIPQGLQHLTTLSKLTWAFDPSDELGPSKAKDIRDICRHVPTISILGLQNETD